MDGARAHTNTQATGLDSLFTFYDEADALGMRCAGFPLHVTRVVTRIFELHVGKDEHPVIFQVPGFVGYRSVVSAPRVVQRQAGTQSESV